MKPKQLLQNFQSEEKVQEPETIEKPAEPKQEPQIQPKQEPKEPIEEPQTREAKMKQGSPREAIESLGREEPQRKPTHEEELANDEFWNADHERGYGPHDFSDWEDVELLKKAYKRAKDAGMEDSAENALMRIEELGGELPQEEPAKHEVYDIQAPESRFLKNDPYYQVVREKKPKAYREYLFYPENGKFALHDTKGEKVGEFESEDEIKKQVDSFFGEAPQAQEEISDDRLTEEIADNEYVYSGLSRERAAEIMSERLGISYDRAKKFLDDTGFDPSYWENGGEESTKAKITTKDPYSGEERFFDTQEEADEYLKYRKEEMDKHKRKMADFFYQNYLDGEMSEKSLRYFLEAVFEDAEKMRQYLASKSNN